MGSPSALTHGMAAFLAPIVAWIGLAASAVGAADAEQAFERALMALEGNDHDAALVQLDEAIRLEPKEARFRGMRGVTWLGKADYAKGLADLKAAIRLSPGDVGTEYQPSVGARLSAEDLEFGQQQVAGMLRDRPAMARFGRQTAFLSEWAARKFAGEDFGARIEWDPSAPLHSDAEHLAPTDELNAAILVAADYDSGPNRGQARSFEELWAGAVYELHNVGYAREYMRLNDEADAGKVSKEAFVAGILKYELQAAQQTRAFYVQVFLPWMAKKKLPTDPTIWFCDWWDTPASVLESFADKSAYPWHPYARMHDWATVHFLWREGNFTKTLQLLRRMCGEEAYEEEESEVHYWIGRCLARLDKPTEAITVLSEAIQFDPDNAPAYRARGRLYEQLDEKNKAEADMAKAKELENVE